MRKAILAGMALLGLFLLVSGAWSQTASPSKPVTDWERKVYYEAADRSYNLPKGYTNDDYNNMLREVAAKHGLTYGEMKDIDDRVWDQDLTDYEWTIADEIWDKFDVIPKDTSKEEKDRMYEQIYRDAASKYGLPVNVIYDIDERSFWWGW
jgi:hypothetical protein